jgi:hypothetical protein
VTLIWSWTRAAGPAQQAPMPISGRMRRNTYIHRTDSRQHRGKGWMPYCRCRKRVFRSPARLGLDCCLERGGKDAAAETARRAQMIAPISHKSGYTIWARTGRANGSACSMFRRRPAYGNQRPIDRRPTAARLVCPEISLADALILLTQLANDKDVEPRVAFLSRSVLRLPNGAITRPRGSDGRRRWSRRPRRPPRHSA